ncbi:activated RNA polymerase II transcriptional coactivator p15-like [Eublepharis macularius]|uniref:Activated RNA polymerase II transcriptional coactivator p15 n=1 Tax=Eublepharis macularius TaxID=481883 RepID=A0AA97KYK9_EUBMA|nr:activated RNA polymerase II transcriptional coactivator p15-like [Eublepharis macularius]
MPKSKKRVETVSDDNGSEEEIEKDKHKMKVIPSKPPEKKAKMAPKPAMESLSPDNSEENMFQIGKLRYVRVSLFKGKVLVDLREFYISKAGDMKPGRKGISLSAEQWVNLKEIISEIDAAVKKF